MALDTIALPYGIRDIKLTPYTDAAATTLGTPVDLPYGRTLSFKDTEDFDDLRGDDTVVASHGQGVVVEWEMESGGLPFEAWKILAGGTVTTTGTANTQVKTFAKNIANSRPYFKVEGQAISDSGGDVHVVLPRCKATDDLEGEFKDGSFQLTKGKGKGYGSLVAMGTTVVVGDAYVFVQNQQTTAIATS